MASSKTSASALLDALFTAEREVRLRRTRIAEAVVDAPGEMLGAVEHAIAATDDEADDDARSMRLVSLAHLLAGVDGAKPVDLLVRILSSDDGDARFAAGSALEERAFDRFKEVALGVERALESLAHDSPALAELPFVLVDVPEPGVQKLLARFLAHPSPIAVAAGIEAIAELGDPAASKALAKLENDERLVAVDDDDPEAAEVTIGELAREARELLDSAHEGARS